MKDSGENKKTIFLALFVVFFVVFVGAKSKNQEVIELKINGTAISVQVADTDGERERGLSGKTGLRENEGMLFVFESEGHHSFWMKEMNFPIDIAWLDKDKKIIYIENRLGPETYPKSFTSAALSLYVLEVSAGFFAGNEIKIGDTAEF